MYKHFVFQDGTKYTYSYEAGEQEALSELCDRNIQEFYFHERNDSNKFINPLVHVYETTEADGEPSDEINWP